MFHKIFTILLKIWKKDIDVYKRQEWYTKRRADKDLIIKLHTGEGKTLVGLLLLQSLLNSKEGPCLYICPNKYLVRQVCSEADKFGIPFWDVYKRQAEEFFHTEKLLQLLNDHKDKKADNSRKIWTVLTFLIWYDRFFATCSKWESWLWAVSYTHLSPAESRPFFNKFKISRRIGSASAFNVSCIPNNSSHPFI